MNRKDLPASTLVGLNRENPVLDPRAILHHDNRLYITYLLDPLKLPFLTNLHDIIFQNTQVRSLLQHEDFNDGDSEDLMTSSNSVTSRKSSKIRKEEKLSQTNLCSPLDRPSTGDRRTPLKVSASSHSQTSPASSPKSSR